MFCTTGHVTQACGSPVPAMSNLNNSNNMPTSPTGSDDMRYHGTELVMLYDYKVSFFLRNCTTTWLQGKSVLQHCGDIFSLLSFHRRKLLTICRFAGVIGSTPI